MPVSLEAKPSERRVCLVGIFDRRVSLAEAIFDRQVSVAERAPEALFAQDWSRLRNPGTGKQDIFLIEVPCALVAAHLLQNINLLTVGGQHILNRKRVIWVSPHCLARR